MLALLHSRFACLAMRRTRGRVYACTRGVCRLGPPLYLFFLFVIYTRYVVAAKRTDGARTRVALHARNGPTYALYSYTRCRERTRNKLEQIQPSNLSDVAAGRMLMMHVLSLSIVALVEDARCTLAKIYSLPFFIPVVTNTW